ncbi:hypothetical protein Pla52o_38750 [Novipirellula galeiformis]|uniref:Alpha/beta hydrolase family protein n=1 Tax=Novipirellula galeiformis TaxID=2528004 RepID=A0A5C6CBT3_9BACT|nr:hypothetical protein [Novipirellula galeiformis]TWU21688.1 hypothetical protein Pla52o_38750 [Novipirellula galeiformis]
MAFRNLDASVARLAARLEDDHSGRRIALVTHSFGDWVARRAIASATQHRVAALVSITPVLRTGIVPYLIHGLTGNLISEIEVINDPMRASADASVDKKIKRLVLWAQLDAYVRPLDIDGDDTIAVHHFLSTHLSIILQPNSLRLITRFLFPTPATTCGLGETHARE